MIFRPFDWLRADGGRIKNEEKDQDHSHSHGASQLFLFGYIAGPYEWCGHTGMKSLAMGTSGDK